MFSCCGEIQQVLPKWTSNLTGKGLLYTGVGKCQDSLMICISLVHMKKTCLGREVKGEVILSVYLNENWKK